MQNILFTLVILATSAYCSDVEWFPANRTYGHAVPLWEPDVSHTKFVLNDIGIDFLKGIQGPISLVSIGGTAKSGKSSLFNSLLNVPQNHGVNVGVGYVTILFLI
jgi:hypothetical protein